MKTAIAALALIAASFPALAHAQAHPALTDPSQATETAPETFNAKFTTTKGDVVFACTRAWAPHGVDRFYNLIKIGFFDDMALFRVKKGFVVQWGIHGTPEVAAAWQRANLPVDPVTQSNTPGMLTYAMAGSPTTRSTQLFINYGNNANLDRMGFAPICKVSEGMPITEQFYGGYDEQLTSKQGEIQSKGNAYLRAEWPELDYIKSASIVGETGSAPAAVQKPVEEEGSNTTTIVVVVAALALCAFVLMRRKGDEAPAPKPSKAPRQGESGAKKRTKQSTSSKNKTTGKKKASANAADAPRKKRKKKKRPSET